MQRTIGTLCSVSVILLALTTGPGAAYETWTWPHESGHIWEALSPHPSYRF